ncbi:Phosphinothricin N-acetyltransferase [Methylobrevis pamukkalensis]|uniref:Phosphinothricin N-acetyltransferase n=2 Tax=Methylobrevis pamukkalensis TaxID=1439726 RepID=A0A1E3H6Y4_9HYPH|nr:GNAT family N-acetyltransferase [Methylobrevis pamukkalensis]ODN72099.1 Phosphinothricin N-acetyltransferase [Methylobrevis pamukkalensis]
MSIDIRRAKLQDAAAVAEVHDHAWRNAYRGILPGVDLERMVERRGPQWWQRAIRRKIHLLVLEVDRQIVGYATLGPSRMRSLPHKGEIYEIYLRPEYQGIGLGRRLFQAARSLLDDMRFKGLAVRALKANDTAVGFYRRLGGNALLETGERIGDSVLPVVVFGWDLR